MGEIDAVQASLSPSEMALIDWGEQKTPEDIIIEWEKESALRSALMDLTPKQQRVLTLRFGLNENKKLTLREIADQWGVSQVRVRQIEQLALYKLKKPSFSQRLLAAGCFDGILPWVRH